MIHLIGNGTIEVVDKERQTVVGYAYVEDGTGGVIQKVQRWVLYHDYRAPPFHSVILRKPSSSARQYTQLSQWTNALREGDLWKEGATYIKANCTSYASIVYSAELPPRPGDQQLLDGVSTVIQNQLAVGHAYAVQGGNYEHWVLFGGFAAAPATAVEVGAPSEAQAAPTLELFLERMKKNWQAGSTYMVCACASFSAIPAAP